MQSNFNQVPVGKVLWQFLSSFKRQGRRQSADGYGIVLRIFKRFLKHSSGTHSAGYGVSIRRLWLHCPPIVGHSSAGCSFSG